MKNCLERKKFGKMPYILKRPEGSSGKLPTIIFLHGAGTRGTDLGALEQNCFFGVKSYVSDPESPFQVFAPLCTRDSWFDVFEQLQEFVIMVVSCPEVDASRICLMGTSMGGYGAWQLAMTMPEYFAALVPICGGGMRWNLGRIKHIPVWAFHGREDTTVPVVEGIAMVNRLNQLGGNAKLTILEQTGHNSWEYAYTHEELFHWILRQEKDRTLKVEGNEYIGSKCYG
jgi:predicted peptidase